MWCPNRSQLRSWDYLVGNLVILVVSFVISKKTWGCLTFFFVYMMRFIELTLDVLRLQMHMWWSALNTITITYSYFPPNFPVDIRQKKRHRKKNSSERWPKLLLWDNWKRNKTGKINCNGKYTAENTCKSSILKDNTPLLW